MTPEISFSVPIDENIPTFKFPEYSIIELPNGINLYLYKERLQPLVFIKILFSVGAFNEKVFGSASFAARMMTRGTYTRTAERINKEIDSIGASLNISAFWDFSQAIVSGLSRFTDKMLDILFDCCFNPSFKEKEIASLKKKFIADILQDYSDSDYLAQVAFDNLIYRNNPYSHPIMGTPETIQCIGCIECQEYHSSMIKFAPVIIICGDIDDEKIVRQVERYTDGYKFHNTAVKKLKVKGPSGIRLGMVHKQGAVQATIRLGKITIGREHRLFPNLQLANTIFGGYFHSRLNQVLREDKGYTYGVSSGIYQRRYASAQVVSAHIKDDSVAEVIETIISEMYNISKKGFKPDELWIAQRYVIGSFLRSVETPQQIASMLQTIALHDLDYNYYDKYYKLISRLKQIDLARVMNYFKPENLVIAVAGDSQKLKGAMRRFGDVVELNEAGEKRV